MYTEDVVSIDLDHRPFTIKTSEKKVTVAFILVSRLVKELLAKP